jgi:DNA-binding GntR family transcriptional regulator
VTADSKGRKAAMLADLKQQVLTMAREPGADLDEASLSTQYGLSRTPLREVLRELAGLGYVALHPNRGARVADMSYRTLRDFFLTAPMIYSAVMRLAAQNATASQIASLRDAQEDFRVALRGGSARDRTLANYRFHAITGAMADNPYLKPSFERLLIDHARIGMTFYRPRDAASAEKLGEAGAQHDAIIAAIEAGDEAGAEALAIDHWNLSRGQIEMFVMPAGLDAPLGAPMQTRTA